jgi:hypothetical protein
MKILDISAKEKRLLEYPMALEDDLDVLGHPVWFSPYRKP